MNTCKTIIDISNISFAYQGRKIELIKNFSYQIFSGSITALLGLNGTGKTTLMLIILGFFQPDEGKVSINCDDQENNQRILDGKIGYLSQSENIPFDYSIREFVLLGRAPYVQKFSTPSNRDIEICDELITSLDLKSLKNCKLGEISGGELQRVRIARTLAQQPDIILMDEPMTHLDIKNKQYLLRLIGDLKKKGKAIIFSTHDPQDALNVSDNCIIMGKSKNILAGNSNDMMTNSILTEYFEIPISVKRYDDKNNIFMI